MTIEITAIRATNGERMPWIPFEKEIASREAMEVLRTLNKIHHKCKHIDFKYRYNHIKQK